MAQQYRTNADEQWARRDDAKRKKEKEEVLVQQDRERLERQKRPAWGVMQLDSRWLWAAWKVRSEEVTAGGVELRKEDAEQKALARSMALHDDWMMESALYRAYCKLKTENRLE